MISVIIPVYNNQDTISDCLCSVLNQTRADLISEIIIINDGSTDASLGVIQEFFRLHKTIKYTVIDQENQGPSAARNAGMRIAEGEWIALLDADDIWLPEKTAIQMSYIEQNAAIDLIGGNHQEKPLRILTKRITRLYRAHIGDLCIKWFPVTPSILIKRVVFEVTGGFDETMRHAEDGEFLVRVCSCFGYYYMPERIVEIGHGKKPFGEKGLSANMKEMYDGNVEIFRRLRRKGEISRPFYCFVRAFAYLKYLRRLVIVAYRRAWKR